MALIVSTWHWGDKFGPEYVTRLMDGVARNITRPFRFMVCKPGPDDAALVARPGCFARLRMFDPAWQEAQGIERGDKVLNLDLDLIVTGNLDAIAGQAEPFTILQGVNASNPCPFNGSVWSFTAGAYPRIWEDFSLEAAQAVPFDSFPDDQAWFHHMVPNAGAYGPESGVYAYQKPGWPRGEALPRNAAIVAFPGWRDPAGFTHIPWVREHWLGERPGR